MKKVRPKLYPHCGTYAYTPRGFKGRVRRRLLQMGFSAKQVGRLEDLYFGSMYAEHQDYTGTFLNQRRYRLHRLSRKLKGDRKRRLFDLVESSGLFFCFYHDDGSMAAFVSPRAACLHGLIPVDRL